MPIIFSRNYYEKKKRIQNLPKIYENIMIASMKEDAIKMVEIFREGIKNDEFGFDRLVESTVKQKRSKGFTQPETPLYGKGDSRKKDSYMNMLRIKKIKDGFKVYPSKGKHWTGDIALDYLLAIHENGAKIEKKDGTIIQIPPRPAFKKSHEKLISGRTKVKKQRAKKIRQALTEYVNKSKDRLINTMTRFLKDKRFDDE